MNEQTDTPYEFRQQVQEQIGSVEVYDLSHIIMPWSLTKRGPQSGSDGRPESPCLRRNRHNLKHLWPSTLRDDIHTFLGKPQKTRCAEPLLIPISATISRY